MISYDDYLALIKNRYIHVSLSVSNTPDTSVSDIPEISLIVNKNEKNGSRRFESNPNDGLGTFSTLPTDVPLFCSYHLRRIELDLVYWTTLSVTHFSKMQLLLGF